MSSLPIPLDSGKRLLPWLVAVAFFMEALDTTILNTAVPAIAKTLAVSPLRKILCGLSSDIHWLIASRIIW